MSPAAQRQFDRRRFGVMKKANEINLRFGAKVAVFILHEEDHWDFRSEPNWPPEMSNTCGNLSIPSDFITHSDHIRGQGGPTNALAESMFHGNGTGLDDESIAVLRNIAPTSHPQMSAVKRLPRGRRRTPANTGLFV
ncbi:hypothetical protein N431DRAFT_466104 [Stipitochalara longipes BDJ]|nr:hypothetical protein N431DRAFT_466104 [Stipitochalara longipes BDJ]